MLSDVIGEWVHNDESGKYNLCNWPGAPKSTFLLLSVLMVCYHAKNFPNIFQYGRLKDKVFDPLIS